MITKLFYSIKKEVLEIIHDRTMLAIILIFPVFVMFFMGSSFGKVEINGLPVGIVGPGNSSFSNLLISSLNQSKAFNVQIFQTTSNATAALKDGKIKALIDVPDDFEENLLGGKGAAINISIDNSDVAVEKSILAILSAVLQASSTNITKTYVNSAWQDLKQLNHSAVSLSEDIGTGRNRLMDTKTKLSRIKADINNLDISAMENSINAATNSVSALQTEIASQKESYKNTFIESEGFLNRSETFVYSASAVVYEAIEKIDNTSTRLGNQITDLEDTLQRLEAALTSARVLRSNIQNTSCNISTPTVDLVIVGLESIRNNTAKQIFDARKELAELANLRMTLVSFQNSLNSYSFQISEARRKQNTTQALSALDSLSGKLTLLNGSFDGARKETAKLRSLVSGINNAITDMENTLDRSLTQTDSVSSLIKSLEKTVREQTAKNPEHIASPLTVGVSDQYKRSNFVDFILPQVISVSLLFSCFLLASISIVREKTRKTIVRLLLIPGGLTNSVFAKIATIVLTSFIQVSIIITIGIIVFGVHLPANIGMMIIGTGVSASALTIIGIVIGFYSKTESAAIQSCLLVAIPMLFLGNIIFSADLLPLYTQLMQQLLPLAHVTNIFKIVLITNGNPFADIAALFSYIIFALIILGFVMSKKQL